MDTKKALIIYLVSILSWFVLELVALLSLNGMSFASILAGAVALILLINSLYFLSNISVLVRQLEKSQLTIAMPVFLLVAVLEISLWASGQGRLAHSEIYDVFLVSGLGLIVITVGFMIYMSVRSIRAK